MTTPRDPNELIRAFLDEGPTDLREQVYDEVRTEIDHTNQRTGFGPWRNLSMNRFAAFAAVTVVIAVAVIVGLTLGGGGPLIGGDPSLSPSIEPSEAPSAEATAPATESVEPSVEPSAEAPVDDLEPFSCGQTEIGLEDAEGTNQGFAPLQLVDVRVAGHDGYDRVVFEYAADVFPNVRLERDDGPYVQDPSGLPVDVDGSPVYLVNITGASKRDAGGNLGYSGPTDLEPGLEQIVHLVEQGDFEAVNNWYLGLNGSTCLRLFALSDPGRLVIDVQH